MGVFKKLRQDSCLREPSEPGLSSQFIPQIVATLTSQHRDKHGKRGRLTGVSVMHKHSFMSGSLDV